MCYLLTSPTALPSLLALHLQHPESLLVSASGPLLALSPLQVCPNVTFPEKPHLTKEVTNVSPAPSLYPVALGEFSSDTLWGIICVPLFISFMPLPDQKLTF